MAEYTDWRGTPIEVGCKIVYGVCADEGLETTEAEVLRIVPQPWMELQGKPSAFYIHVKPLRRASDVERSEPKNRDGRLLKATGRVTVIERANSEGHNRLAK
jgi:hypothetical protein